MTRYFYIAVFATLAAVTSRANPYLPSSLLTTFYEFTGYGGTGSDGALTVNGVPNGPSNPLYTDDVRTYLTAAATSGVSTVTVASSTGFSVGNEVLLIQVLGAGQGSYETRTVSAITGTSLTFSQALTNSYPTYSAGSTVTQVIRVPHYTQVTINSGGYLTVHPFDGATGGVMFFRASTGITINYNATLSGTISVSGKGYRGGALNSAGGGPGGGSVGQGGQNTTPGTTNKNLVMASGGGGSSSALGGAGGGIMMLKTSGTILIDGNLSANGDNAAGANAGGGAGGTVAISADIISRASTCGPTQAQGGSATGSGTSGAHGRFFMLYKTSISCTNAIPATGATFQKFQLR